MVFESALLLETKLRKLCVIAVIPEPRIFLRDIRDPLEAYRGAKMYGELLELRALVRDEGIPCLRFTTQGMTENEKSLCKVCNRQGFAFCRYRISALLRKQ